MEIIVSRSEPEMSNNKSTECTVCYYCNNVEDACVESSMYGRVWTTARSSYTVNLIIRNGAGSFRPISDKTKPPSLHPDQATAAAVMAFRSLKF